MGPYSKHKKNMRTPKILTYNLSPHVTESGFPIPESGKFLLVEPRIQEIYLLADSEILGFGMRNTNQGIWNLTIDCNPES